MKRGKRFMTGTVILALSACLIAAGVMRGELSVIFVKAVNICLECIGLG